jgi:hypothetical protein
MKSSISGCPARAITHFKRHRFAETFSYGETRTRTGDTTIFSRVLYQLSYLAAVDASTRPMLLARRPR